MKKFYILLIIMTFFVISIVSAEYESETWCKTDPDFGANYMLDPVVCGSTPVCDGYVYGMNKYGGYGHGYFCLTDWYYQLDYSGDKFYIIYQTDSWDNVWIEGTSLKSNSKVNPKQAYVGKTYPVVNDGKMPYYTLYSIDIDNGYIRGKQGGYLNDDYFSAHYWQVDCYDDTNCDSNQYCDTSSLDGDDWSCKTKECIVGENKCINNDYYVCNSDYEWINNGKVINQCDVQCLDHSDCDIYDGFVGEQYCDGITLVQKYDDYNCVGMSCTPPSVNQVFKDIRNIGLEVGKCGVECLTDSDCNNDGYVGEKYCQDNNVFYNYEDYYCSINDSNTCKFELIPKMITECEDLCIDSQCIDRTFFEKVIDFIKELFMRKN